MTADIALFLDPPSEHFLEDRLFEPSTARYGGDDILAPYRAIRERFAEIGVPVHTADRLEGAEAADLNIHVSFGMQERSARLEGRPDTILSGYFAMECPIVEPSLYEGLPEMERRFRRLFTWGPPKALEPFTGSRVQSRRFQWPQSRDAVEPELWRRRDRDFLVMINSNKLPRLYDRELYTDRVEAIEHFHRFGEVDLFGPHWDGAPRRVGKTWVPATLRRWKERLWELKQRIWPHPGYRAAAEAHQGMAESKSETLSRYDFAICFENMALEGWITEKIFDCLFVGTIPVYWGAPDIEEWVPGDCFVDMRQFDDYRELREYLHSLGPDDRDRYREAGKSFLGSEAFDPFRKETFVDRIVGIVEEDAGIPTGRAQRPAGGEPA